jgi:hypothetical protein
MSLCVSDVLALKRATDGAKQALDALLSSSCAIPHYSRQRELQLALQLAQAPQ